MLRGVEEVIRASAPYTSGWGSLLLLKMDCVRVAAGRQFAAYDTSVPGKPVQFI